MSFDDNNQYKQGYFATIHEELKTNWPFDSDDCPARKPVVGKFFIDHRTTGDTIGEATTAKAASDLARLTNGVIRYYEPSLDEDDAERASIRTNKSDGYLDGTKYRKLDNALPMFANPKWYDFA